MTTPPPTTSAGRYPGFLALFVAALGGSFEPFVWQRALADGHWPEVLIAPTGSGKTAGVTLAWMHHRLKRPDSTPRRLVWCLPMRTLVDQTVGEVRNWVQRVQGAGIDPSALLPRAQDVHVLMGGVDSGKWLEAPEQPAIIVGTQDMLLSRALMRGYASSRALWPMEFATLHQDTQWVFDEVQLMGAGRATSAQLEAFRRHEFKRAEDEGRAVGRTCRSLWISATLEPEWLKTVDHSTPTSVLRVDPMDETDSKLRALARAPKHLCRANVAPASSSGRDESEYSTRLAGCVVDAHRMGHMTLVVVNQVKRAQDLYLRVQSILASREHPVPEVALLHSRFRPADRERELAKIRGMTDQSDIVVIATQAVEAGVDISAAVMFTELAPWASMVQRFGRANRRAEVDGGANVFWIDILEPVLGKDGIPDKHAVALSRPYEVDDLREARNRLLGLDDVAPVHLSGPREIEAPLRVVRKRDLEDLFDTDADLTGFDVDISPYVRDASAPDIRVFWRQLPISSDEPPKPSAHELCAVPIGLARKWVQAKGILPGGAFFVRDPQWRRREGQAGLPPPGWTPLRETPWPGLTVMAEASAGGYREDLGFTGDRRHVPTTARAPESPISPKDAQVSGDRFPDESEGHDEDPRSETGQPVSVTDHVRHVAREVSGLCEGLGLDGPTRKILTRAAHWHDLGKAHEVFQDTMRRGLDGQPAPGDVFLAKTVKRNMRHERAFFRHELVSALAFLAHEGWSRSADLVAFLIAAHHGKVRMNIRALPRESAPRDPERASVRFARGVWEGDELPPIDLGGNENWEGGSLTLSVMELGWDEATRESWTERTRDLLAQLGPFQLAWLETLLRVADWRASDQEASGGYADA